MEQKISIIGNRMNKYTESELSKRSEIIKSQIQIGRFLDADIITHLVYLFNTNIMTEYIEDERKNQN